MFSREQSHRESFEAEFNRHFESLLDIALWLTKRRSAAEQLLLNTATQAYRAWPKTDHASSPRVWLLGILTRMYFAGHSTRQLLGPASRREAPTRAANKPDRIPHRTPPLSASELAALIALPDASVKGAVARLSSRSRLLLLLLFRERCSYTDIAHITTLSEGEVRSRLGSLRHEATHFILLQTGCALSRPEETQLCRCASCIAADKWDKEGGATANPNQG